MLPIYIASGVYKIPVTVTPRCMSRYVTHNQWQCCDTGPGRCMTPEERSPFPPPARRLSHRFRAVVEFGHLVQQPHLDTESFSDECHLVSAVLGGQVLLPAVHPAVAVLEIHRLRHSHRSAVSAKGCTCVGIALRQCCSVRVYEVIARTAQHSTFYSR